MHSIQGFLAVIFPWFLRAVVKKGTSSWESSESQSQRGLYSIQSTWKSLWSDSLNPGFGSALPELNALGQRQKSNKILAPHRRAKSETKPSETTVLMKRWIIRQRMVSYLKRLCRAGEALWKMKPFLVVLLFQGKVTLQLLWKWKNPSLQHKAHFSFPSGVVAIAATWIHNNQHLGCYSVFAPVQVVESLIDGLRQQQDMLQAIELFHQFAKVFKSFRQSQNVHPYLFQSLDSAMSAACQPKIPPKALQLRLTTPVVVPYRPQRLFLDWPKELPFRPSRSCARENPRGWLWKKEVPSKCFEITPEAARLQPICWLEFKVDCKLTLSLQGFSA